MCGRYRRKSGKPRIADAFGVTAGLEELDLGPDDDAAPGSMQPVVSINQEHARQIELMRWGFKLPDRLLFNARSEGIAASRFWKDSFLERRCIVPADAVYEWQPGMAGDNKGSKKQKYEITIPGQQPFGMAGIWNLWNNPKTDQWERTFAILTGEPNELMQPIHNRMTTFLDLRWLRLFGQVFRVFKWKDCSLSSRRGKCENRFHRFSRSVGRAGNSLIVFRAFHQTGISAACFFAR